MEESISRSAIELGVGDDDLKTLKATGRRARMVRWTLHVLAPVTSFLAGYLSGVLLSDRLGGSTYPLAAAQTAAVVRTRMTYTFFGVIVLTVIAFVVGFVLTYSTSASETQGTYYGVIGKSDDTASLFGR